jgi:hypothetical protein
MMRAVCASPGRWCLAESLPKVLAQVRLVGEAAPQRNVTQRGSAEVSRHISFWGQAHQVRCRAVRIAQASAWYFQSRLPFVIYASDMSPDDGILTRFADHDSCESTDWVFKRHRTAVDPRTSSLAGVWAVRRAIVRVLSALVSLRLDDALEATDSVSPCGKCQSVRSAGGRFSAAASARPLPGNAQTNEYRGLRNSSRSIASVVDLHGAKGVPPRRR